MGSFLLFRFLGIPKKIKPLNQVYLNKKKRIEKIAAYLKKLFEAEQEFYKQTQENLQKELAQVQNRISRLIDAHLDGKIDGDIYEQKLNEYKKNNHNTA